jgi:hypothetical protein
MKRKNKSKRKPQTQPEGGRVFSSMSTAAAGMAIPLPLLKRLKAAGSPGFELNGRCREAQILQFAAEHAELLDADHVPESYDPLKRMQIEKLRFDLDVKRGQYELVAVTKEVWARAMECVQRCLETYVEKPKFNQAIRHLKRELEALYNQPAKTKVESTHETKLQNQNSLVLSTPGRRRRWPH